ncbi:MAG: DsbE family thiol:disulfide interchange protein [Alphaproteobacteria bacterium]|nr:DsbE family thiol:disulfide interchange protein [Alphaproteobacteria bacterium]
MRRLLYALPLVAFAAIAAWLLFGLGRDANTVPSALIDKPAPVFNLAAVEGLAQPGLATDDLKGKVALVNVFASWCAPCRVEHPVLMRLAREKRVAVFGISHKDKAADSRRFLAELGNPYSAVGWDNDGRVSLEWGVYGVPETFVVDRQGRIRHRHVGALTEDALARTVMPLVARLERE